MGDFNSAVAIEALDFGGDHLSHFGTKGMKWGVRKDKGHEGEQAKTSKIKKLDTKFEKTARSFSTLRKSYNAAALATDHEDLPRINAKRKYDNVDARADNALAKAYRKEYHDAFVQNWQRQLDAMGTNASGTKKIKLYELDDGTWEIKADDISHAGPDGRCFLVPHYENGKIVSSEIVEEGYFSKVEMTVDEIVQALDSDEEDVLAHFGVKGMKWGVIRGKVSGHFEARAAEKKRLNEPNPDLTSRQKAQDVSRFGPGGAARINRSMNQGKTHIQAIKAEEKVRTRNAYIVAGSLMTVYLLNALGPTVMSEVSRKAATNRDKRAQATEDFIRNGPQKPKTKEAKKNFRGVYNVTTM